MWCNGMGWDGMRWDEMRLDEMRWDDLRLDEIRLDKMRRWQSYTKCVLVRASIICRYVYRCILFQVDSWIGIGIVLIQGPASDLFDWRRHRYIGAAHMETSINNYLSSSHQGHHLIHSFSRQRGESKLLRFPGTQLHGILTQIKVVWTFISVL